MPALTLAEAARARGARVYGTCVVPPGKRLTLETILTHPSLFGLTKATPVQRAICRVSDGLDIAELWENANVRQAFGGVKPEPGKPPARFCIFAAIRGGKSLIAAAKAFQATQECDLSHTGPGDEVRVPVLSVDKDAAHAVFRHLVENVQRAPGMRALLAGQPTTDAVKIRHPSGRAIEIKVTAVARAGSTLVARWLPLVIFDEAPRMGSEQDSVQSLEESLRAIDGRIMPGGQVLLIGSPHAPTGLCYELDREHWGKPTATVVARATGPMLNPDWWTPERCEAVRLSDRIAYQANVLAEFVTSDLTMFGLDAVERNTRPSVEPLPYDPLCTYAAAIDPATRRNFWTLAVGTRQADDTGRIRNRVVLTKTYKPGDGTPDEILADIAETVKPYGISVLRTDQWANDVLRSLAQRHGIGLAEETVTQARKVELFDRLRLLTETDDVEFNSDPSIVSDLMRVRKEITQSAVRIATPEAADGGHCDMASALVLLFAYELPAPKVAPPTPGTEAYYAEMMRQDKRKALEKAQEETRRRWKRGGIRSVLGR